ncbi:LuxR C-terminal-related transcriptional regulator [Citrobacter freundii complex sp. 2024EL-00228]|jgi:DNA-binding NarL/FixJ family response regulator|uniref:Response regulator transcription factor n=1 Tax=Citrobacter freundii TaxID=546 RepID=A0A9P3Z1D7_CITFR|nr:LuxR C-terminal-related transcriptional regulator [Citrobacter freundii]EJC8213886.1 response regulator transcription factor [Citrobacter freundii]MBJ9315175.1 response regulator transcription factor [Citrobacter freundii]MDH1412222.1 LuxR C-terminal-related transcriptional regulator [Citrobacter freundii]STB14630.1 DNA-binding transcriptional activator BglJ [Citrobacter freundii]HAU5688986.1 response regulator transcription factor [Citrobacter freundii]
MSKAIFLGDSIYPWLGMREILRGSSLFIDITYYSSQTLSAVKMLPYETDCIIINPDKSDFLKYARIIRNMALRPVTKIIFLADEATFAIFQTVCGKNMQFLDQDTSLDQLLQTVTRITQNKKQQSIKELHTKITANEFNVMMMLARGWSLTQIAGASQKSEKTIGAYKSNIARKLGKNNTRLKYTISHYSQP